MSKNECTIYRIRYSQGQQKHISHVDAQIFEEDGSHTARREFDRDFVISLIQKGYTAKTRVRVYGDTFKDGATVIVWSVKGVNYLKTEPNEIEEDNLGELPLF